MFHTLEKQIGSKLILPGDAQYDDARKVWNGAVDKKPAAIIVCESEEDVVTALKFSNKNNFSVSVRGGGHHVAGLAVCDDGLMIDLSKMRKVTVNQERKVVMVEGGATLADVDGETQKYGLATPTGTVSETGIAGLALGRGLGYLRGKYGLTCDNILGATVVTTDGNVLSVNEEEHSDLFWAIRGGGGNFGVVTKFEFALHHVGPEVYAVDVMYDFEDAKQILQKARKFLNDAPDEAVSFNLTATALPPTPELPEFLHHKKVVMVTAVYPGEVSDGEAIMKPLRELAQPIVDQSGVVSFADFQKKLDPMVMSHIPVYGTSLYFEELNEEVINEIVEKIENAPIPATLVQLWALGGLMNRVAEDATPFAIRNAQFVLLVDSMAMGGEDELCVQWIESIYGGLKVHSYKGSSYLNGIGTSEEITKNAYQENYQRLVEIKKKYDPQNRFRYNHNVKPD